VTAASITVLFAVSVVAVLSLVLAEMIGRLGAPVAMAIPLADPPVRANWA
jgi:hypothetical protein